MDGGFSRDALNLLALGDTLALDRVLEFLDLRPPRAVAAVLEEYVRSRDTKQLADVLDQRLERGWVALKPLLPLIGGLAPNEGVPLLEKLVTHEEPRVRRQAYAALFQNDPDPRSLMRYLRRALADESHRVTALAIQRLTASNHEQALELMGAYVEDGLENVVPEPEFARRAARSLLTRGDAGVERLCTCLDRLSSSPRQRRVRLARVVAETLRALSDRKQVERRLKRWRLSPSGLASLVLPRSERARGGEK
jgi:HEAT repeat protein